MGRRADRRKVVRVSGGESTTRPDTLAVEEPLEVRVNGEQFAITMRTPGDDFELAVGFLVSEGVVASAADVSGIRYCEDGRPDPTYNIVDVTLGDDVSGPQRHRHTYVSSSCGICGRESLDTVRTAARWDLGADDLVVSSELICSLPDRLREGQAVFDRTGGLHAAGLFTANGELVCLREDVGRHNAVDKVVGWSLMHDRLPLRGHVLQLSGRASFELVQKGWLAGIPLLSAVSAPSTLAVDLAEEAGMTLAGFVRGDSMNLYSATQRVRVVAPGGSAPTST